MVLPILIKHILKDSAQPLPQNPRLRTKAELTINPAPGGILENWVFQLKEQLSLSYARK